MILTINSSLPQCCWKFRNGWIVWVFIDIDWMIVIACCYLCVPKFPHYAKIQCITQNKEYKIKTKTNGKQFLIESLIALHLSNISSLLILKPQWWVDLKMSQHTFLKHMSIKLITAKKKLAHLRYHQPHMEKCISMQLHFFCLCDNNWS